MDMRKHRSLYERIGWNHHATVYTAVMVMVSIVVQLLQAAHS